MKVSGNFVLQEFVHPHLYTTFGDGAIRFIDERLIKIAQLLRDLSNAGVVINNYHKGGHFVNRGVRLPHNSFGAAFSMHKQGKAIDVNSTILTIGQLHAIIKDNEKTFFDLGLRRIEDLAFTPTWLHLDLANTRLDHIAYIKPDHSMIKNIGTIYDRNDI